MSETKSFVSETESRHYELDLIFNHLSECSFCQQFKIIACIHYEDLQLCDCGSLLWMIEEDNGVC